MPGLTSDPFHTSQRESQPLRPHLPFLAQMGDFQVSPVLVLDPLHPLLLGIDQQGPALTVRQDGGVFGGHSVTGQAFIIPGGDGGVVRQHGNQIPAFGYRNGNL